MRRIGGRVGRVVGGDASTVRLLLEAGRVPVLSSIATDGSGGLLNINADDAAAALAAQLDASRVLLLTDVPGVLGETGKPLASISLGEVDRLIAAGTVTGGMAAKTRAAAALAASTGAEVVVAAWNDAAAVFDATPGIGTRVMGNEIVKGQP